MRLSTFDKRDRTDADREQELSGADHECAGLYYHFSGHRHVDVRADTADRELVRQLQLSDLEPDRFEHRRNLHGALR